MSNYSSRPEKIYDLRLLDLNPIFQPEQTILLFGNSLSLDIGILCYLNRSSSRSRNTIAGCKVDLSSLNSARTYEVSKLILHLVKDFSESRRSPSSLHEKASRFVTFIIWADTNNRHNILSSVNASKSAAKAYAAHLLDRVAKNEISVNYQREIVQQVFNFIGEYFGLDDLNSIGKKNYVLPISDEDLKNLQPSQAILQFGNLSSVDIGMLCYKQVIASPQRSKILIETYMDQNSIDPARTPQISALIKHISLEFSHGKLKPSHLCMKVKLFIKFIAWADRHGHNDVLVNVKAAKLAIYLYAQHFQDFVSRKTMSEGASKKQLSYVNSMLSGIYSHAFVNRLLDRYDLSAQRNMPITQPELIVLQIAGKSADVGSLCYIKRIGETNSKKGRNVDTDSFYPARIPSVCKLIALIEKMYSYSNLKPATLYDKVSRFIVFIEWADECGHHLVLDNVDAARLVARAYAAHIRERVAMNEISQNSGASQQWIALSFLGDFFGVDDFMRGLNLLYKIPNAKESTPLPSADSMKKVYTLCECMFNGYTELVLDKKLFPYKLKIPEYLDWSEDGLWIFPTTIGFMPPHVLLKRHTLATPLWAFNFENGRLSTTTELQTIDIYANQDDAYVQKTISYAEIIIKSANTNPYNVQRLRAGQLALNTFIVMFSAQTGMNWAQIENLQWSDDYEIGVERQGFRVIKPRAGNREIYFELPIQFMPTFRRFLELRRYLLNERTCNTLFFGFGFNLATGYPRKIKDIMGSTFKCLRRIDPHLPKIKSRQWRASLSDWLIRNTDPSTTAMILQNTEKTVLSSYSTGTESSQVEELTEFFDNVSTVLSKNQFINKGNELSIGLCSSQGEPLQISRNMPIQPDCKKVEGCFFCDKFKVHADEKDARKLLSCRYFLNQTSVRFNNREQFGLVVGPVISRIDWILKEISTKEEKLVPRITREVDQGGDLDPYWASKLEMFMELSA